MNVKKCHCGSQRLFSTETGSCFKFPCWGKTDESVAWMSVGGWVRNYLAKSSEKSVFRTAEKGQRLQKVGFTTPPAHVLSPWRITESTRDSGVSRC